MGDMRPAKAKKLTWVVRVNWKENICQECLDDILRTCDMSGIEIPKFTDTNFCVPYYWLESKCIHTSSPHYKECPVVSSYVKKP